jgi:O-antigen/teichoic acid export membrane protein
MLALALIAWLSGIVHGNAVPYFIALIGLAFNVPLNSANNVWMGLQKGYVSGFWELMQTVLTTAALIAATRVTANLQSYVVIVYLCLVTANLGSLLHLLWRHPELRPGLSIVKPSLMKAVASTGILFFALGATGGLAFLLDNVLALQLLGPEAAARMTIAMRICMTASAMLVVLSQPLWPAFAEAAHTGDRGWIRRGFLRGAALLVGLSVLGSIVLLLFGERFLVLWLHTNLGIGRGFLLAIGAWVLAQAVIRVPTLLLNGLSLIRFQVIVCWIATAAALVMKFAFAKTFGVSGILWGTTLAVLLMVAPAEIWRIFKWVGTPAKLEPGPDMPDEALSTLDRSLFGA